MPRLRKRITYTTVAQWKPFLETMGKFRDALLKAEENMAFYEKEHLAADKVRAEIDGLAGVLTGDPRYYYLRAQGEAAAAPAGQDTVKP
jgi:hypothetical protein